MGDTLACSSCLEETLEEFLATCPDEKELEEEGKKGQTTKRNAAEEETEKLIQVFPWLADLDEKIGHSGAKDTDLKDPTDEDTAEE
eukprot:10658312-Lingulodinium_polyedra.AAC.1